MYACIYVCPAYQLRRAPSCRRRANYTILICRYCLHEKLSGGGLQCVIDVEAAGEGDPLYLFLNTILPLPVLHGVWYTNGWWWWWWWWGFVFCEIIVQSYCNRGNAHTPRSEHSAQLQDALVRALCPVALRAGLLRAAWRTALCAWRWRKAGSFLPHSNFVFSKRKLQKLCMGRWGPVSLKMCVLSSALIFNALA